MLLGQSGQVTDRLFLQACCGQKILPVGCGHARRHPSTLSRITGKRKQSPLTIALKMPEFQRQTRFLGPAWSLSRHVV
jgi:hypothetical protein